MPEVKIKSYYFKNISEIIDAFHVTNKTIKRAGITSRNLKYRIGDIVMAQKIFKVKYRKKLWSVNLIPNTMQIQVNFLFSKKYLT